MNDITTPSSPVLGESDTSSETGDQSPQIPRTMDHHSTSKQTQRQRELGLMRDGGGASSASFVGSASGIHFIRAVYNAFSKKTGDADFALRDRHLVPGEDDHLEEDRNRAQANINNIWSSSEVSSQDIAISDAFNVCLSFEDLVAWTQSYFDSWHPSFPFLHGPSLMDILERISLGGIDAVDDVALITVRSIISISLADVRQGKQPFTKPVPSSLTFTTYEEALNSLHIILVRPTTIAALQASVSVQLFLVSMLRLNAASRVGGLVVRMALHIGLHRCPSRFPNFSEDECKVRQRLFWSIYCLDRYLCQALGLPLNIRDHDVDVCFPNQERHLSNSYSGQQTRQGGNNLVDFDERLRLQMLLSKHAKLRGMILELRNKSVQHSSDGGDHAIRIGAQLSRWWCEVEDLREQETEDEDIRMYEPNEGSPPSQLKTHILRPIHQLVLLVSKHESLTALNRPVMTASKGTAAYDVAFQTCIESSRSIISSIKDYLAHNKAEAQNANLTTGAPTARYVKALSWPSFTWAVWMSAFILIYAASEDQIALKTATRNVHSGINILQHLSLRGNTWADACAMAIRDLHQALVQKQQSFRKRKSSWESSSRQRPNLLSPTSTRTQVSDGSGSSPVSPLCRIGANTRPLDPRSVAQDTHNPGVSASTAPLSVGTQSMTESNTAFSQQPDVSNPLIAYSDFPYQSINLFGHAPFGAGTYTTNLNRGEEVTGTGVTAQNDSWLDTFLHSSEGLSSIDDPFTAIEFPLYLVGDTDVDLPGS